jgi:hypothetical protein
MIPRKCITQSYEKLTLIFQIKNPRRNSIPQIGQIDHLLLGGPLSQGVLEKTRITCPWRGWQYDVRNGKSPHPGGDSVKSFKAKAIGNKLYIVLLTSN